MLKLAIYLRHLMHLLAILSILPAGSVTDTQVPLEAARHTGRLLSRLLSPDMSHLQGHSSVTHEPKQRPGIWIMP